MVSFSRRLPAGGWATRPSLLLLAALLVPLAGAGAESKAGKKRHGMVVAVSPAGADVGRDILLKGGNAVDAAVATALAMAVTYPAAGNIGGGGFMVIHPGLVASQRGPREPIVIEYREKAPLAATRTMYTRADGWYTAKAAGVPGTVRGLALAQQRYGRLPWQPSQYKASGGRLASWCGVRPIS